MGQKYVVNPAFGIEGDEVDSRSNTEAALDYLSSMSRVAGQGLTMGFGDEIVAGIEAGLFGGDYDEALARERAIYDQAYEDHPVSSVLVEIGGTLVPASLLFKALAPLRLARAGQASATGAIEEGIAGFGSGQGFDDRVDSAAERALLGAVAGPVVEAGMRSAGRGIRKTGGALRRFARRR